MEYKAVIFDMFETLITEWGHEKYTKSKMCSDLDITPEAFIPYWEEKEQDRYLGQINFADSILYACGKCGKVISADTLAMICDKRMKTKSACFEYVNPDVYELLRELREKGLKLAIVSNCSSEEVQVIKESRIYPYFDVVILSYEVGMRKPEQRIYADAMKRLNVRAEECIFVGDGGSNELEGAKGVGMKAIQAKWYTNHHSVKRENISGFQTAENPLDILKILGLNACRGR